MNKGLKDAYRDADQVVAKCNGRGHKPIQVISNSQSLGLFPISWTISLRVAVPEKKRWEGTDVYEELARILLCMEVMVVPYWIKAASNTF